MIPFYRYVIRLVKKSTVSLSLVLFSSVSFADNYKCTVTRKVDFKYEYTREQLVQNQFEVLVHKRLGDVVLSRCSWSQSVKAHTCDTYDIDRIEVDEHIGARKYYVFSSQFDVQIFQDLKFVENNGRGGVAYGFCNDHHTTPNE